MPAATAFAQLEALDGEHFDAGLAHLGDGVGVALVGDDDAGLEGDGVIGVVPLLSFLLVLVASRLDDGFLDATALMEYLIRQGIPMRTGHEVVGKLVADCEQRGCALKDLPLADLQAASSLIDESVYRVLGAENAAWALISFGSGGPEQVRERLKEWQKRV